MRMLQPPELKGVKNSKKQTIEHYQSWFLNTKKIRCTLAMLVLEFKDDLYNFRWRSYSTLNRLK
jgi:hypothetical protein